MPVRYEYRAAWWRRWLARPIIRFLLRLLFHILAPVKIIGKGNVPLHQAYIVAINHVSLYDPPFAGVFWPEQVEAMGAVEIWSRPGQSVLARLWGGIPVHRGKYDRALFDKVISALHSGYPLLIAPEGERSHKPGLQCAKPGIAYLVEQTGLPVVPAGIVGTTDDFWQKASKGKRPPLEMRIGKPIHLPRVTGKGSHRRAGRQRNADLVMAHSAGLLPEEYRGVYADSAIFPAEASG
ncbi:MAG: lysophospholipid acyltransferase family protein, partial [Anaerolineales bacterium]|nr:lysophospholipid acyltransferase family protein [Anaerolineales bacterium]